MFANIVLLRAIVDHCKNKKAYSDCHNGHYYRLFMVSGQEGRVAEVDIRGRCGIVPVHLSGFGG